MNFYCPICLESFTSKCEISSTQCGHIFHSDCIQKWLKLKRQCPFCLEKAFSAHKIFLPIKQANTNCKNYQIDQKNESYLTSYIEEELDQEGQIIGQDCIECLIDQKSQLDQIGQSEEAEEHEDKHFNTGDLFLLCHEKNPVGLYLKFCVFDAFSTNMRFFG